MRQKWLKPTGVGTYQGLLMYATKMRRLHLNKIRLLSRRSNKQTRAIQELDGIVGNFYRTGKIERKMIGYVLEEIAGRGFDTKVLMAEAHKKLVKWMKTDEYKKIATTVVRSK